MRVNKHIKNHIKKQSVEYSFDNMIKAIGGKAPTLKDYDANLKEFLNDGQSQKKVFKANRVIKLKNNTDGQFNNRLEKILDGHEATLKKVRKDKKIKKKKEIKEFADNQAKLRIERKRQRNLDKLKEFGLI